MPARIPTCHPVESRRRFRRLALALILPLALPAAAAIPGIELVDRTTIASYIGANGPSLGPLATSSDGRYTMFLSTASNLVPGDGNGGEDLFVYDANGGPLERINVASDGSEATATPSTRNVRGGISADGRYVTFASAATNLVAEPTHGKMQIYRRDRVSGTTALISRGSDGLAATEDVWAGATTPDGRYTVFATSAANFPGTDVNMIQVYRYDAGDGSLVRATVSTDGQPTSATRGLLEISDDGRFVLFASYADNLAPGPSPASVLNYFLRDLTAGTTQRVTVDSTGASLPQPGLNSADDDVVEQLSADGRYAVFSTNRSLSPADTDAHFDVYRFDRLSGTTTLVSDASSGGPALPINILPSISADGRKVLFVSITTDVLDPMKLFVRDMDTGMLTSLAIPTMRYHIGYRHALSRDGGIVHLSTTELPPNDGMVHAYRFNAATGAMTRLSRAATGSFGPYADGQADIANRPSLSAQARHVAFASKAGNLVAGDDNDVSDVFVRDRWNETTERVSRRADGSESTCQSRMPTITPDARFVVFESCGALVAPASGMQYEIYRYDRISSALELVSIAAGGTRADGNSFGAHISDDGRYVAFRSCASNLAPIGSGHACQVYLRDMDAGTTTLVSRSNGGQAANSYSGVDVHVSGNGRFVGYSSSASNLVANDTNDTPDTFVFDRMTGSTERVSVSSSGVQGAGSSYFRGFDYSGNLALMESTASNLTNPVLAGPLLQRTYLRDRGAGTTTLLAIPGDTTSSSMDPSISPDGRFVALIGRFARSGVGEFDDSQKDKLFVLDRNDGRYRALTWFTSERPQSETRKPQLSADGQWIAFASTRDDLSDEDGNGQFADVFLTRSNDPIFADDFD